MTTTTREAVMKTNLPLRNRRQGKVRDVYETTMPDGTEAMVLVASDRISAFDVIMTNGLPGKGIVLTQISRFWFEMIGKKLGDRLRHHIISTNAEDVPGLSEEQVEQVRGRVTIGRKTTVVPIECVVRGYLAGSGWKEYRESQSVCGVKLPAGLKQSSKLPEPIFTPATKEASGHDENIDFERACQIAGRETMERLRELSIAVYRMGHDYAAQRGIILADTKFEFGKTKDGTLLLIDEVLTPDSSRFWPAAKYAEGRDQESFDKQYLRNYLEGLVAAGKWNKTPPGVTLPDEVVRNTMAKYLEAYRALMGRDLDL